MSEEKHIEWIADHDPRDGMEWNIHIVERDRPHMRICFMSNGPESEANAARIIQTNAVPALVAALEEARDGIIAHGIGPAVPATLARIDAALAAHRKDS